MRISDWSSDVCSSDLLTLGGARYHAGYYESSRLVPYPPGFGRTAIAQKTAEISRFLDVLGRPRKYKWCPEEELNRSEEHTSELQSLMRISYAVFCLKKKNNYSNHKKLHSVHH